MLLLYCQSIYTDNIDVLPQNSCVTTIHLCMYVSLSASCYQPLKVFRFSGQVKEQKQRNQQKMLVMVFALAFFIFSVFR